MTDSSTGLEVRDLKRIFVGGTGSNAIGIHEISLSVGRGKFLTLLGPSGCGKTTTLRCIAGLEVPDSGQISALGRDFYNSDADINVPLHRRHIGMVFQSYAIWPHMTVAQNVAFPLKMAKDEALSSDQIRKRVREALAMVGMADLENRHPFQLSGGQQQRVALARAIVRRPSLLLLDEPLSNLDAVLRDEMRTELRRLQQQLGTTTIYVTHDQQEALEMSDMIAVMRRGHIIQYASPKDIYFNPRDQFVAQFMGARNLLEGKVSASADSRGIGQVTLSDGRIVGSLLAEGAETVGRPVSLYIRPESVRIRSTKPDSTSENALAGEILSYGFQGHTNRVRLQIGTTVLEANTGHDTSFDVGQQVTMLFDCEETLALSKPS